MDKQDVREDIRHIEERMEIHLLMVCMASMFSLLSICFTIAAPWEWWTVPLIIVGNLSIWCLHIGNFVSGKIYEYLCTGFMLVECFYFGVHRESFISMPVLVCLLFLLLVLLEKKFLVYLVEIMYLLSFFYYFLLLGFTGENVMRWDLARIAVGLSGTIGAMIFSLFIIDRRRAGRREIQRMERKVAAAKQQNADFLSNVSHELRTPINMVTGISEVELGRDLPKDLRDSMCSIQMAGRRLAEQINDILDYTEIAGNTLVVTNDNYMPASIINDIVVRAGMMEQNPRLELVFDVDTALPSLLIGDAEKISRVLWILFQNAVKFTEEGGVYVYMGFRQESYGINLNFIIEDTGKGMMPAQISSLYQDFFQAESGCSRCGKGLGLGVSIARGFLKALGGFLHFESLAGQGTKVTISIPQKVADETPCMTVSQAKSLCIACFFKRDKYGRSEVREYYDRMIRHLAKGLGIPAYLVNRMEELDKLLHTHEITHLFLASEEYEQERTYFEELGKNICIALIAAQDFTMESGSSLYLLQKPFFGLPIVNFLNGMVHGVNLGVSMQEDRAFTCAGLKALVVDDEEMNLVVARGILNRYGMQTDTCLSGAAAVEQCMKTEYGLIFLDHMMPGMDGVETLKRIRELHGGFYKNLPIVALTANAISGAREMFKSEGFTEFVPKPVERCVLERVLRKILPEECIQYEAAGDEKAGKTEERTKKPETKPEYGEDLPVDPAHVDSLSVWERLQQLGIDAKLGLDYCAGAEDFYLEMLQMYYEQEEEKERELTSFFENGDWAAYSVKVHALKSTSLTIGAKKISELAKALEAAGKAEDEAYIRENHDHLMQKYKILCQGIASCIEEKGGSL
ncbi:sensor histidine kinase [Lachnospiraceae bacterium]|nr:sensor histidine kinase [Lachnospiraceae bacterium]